MDQSTVEIIIHGLAGPAGAMVLLALVLFGIGYLVNKMIDKFATHLIQIETLVGKIAEEVSENRQIVSEIKGSLRK